MVETGNHGVPNMQMKVGSGEVRVSKMRPNISSNVANQFVTLFNTYFTPVLVLGIRNSF